MAKIMLVEDDQMIADIYMKKFETAGFEVVNAVTGKEVLKYALESNFDLILLDMVLPEMSGMDVLKELRANPAYDSDLKVVIFSNLSKAEYEADTKQNGADGFIGKMQFTPSDLVTEIGRLLNEYAEQKKNKERMNGGKSEIKCAGKKILFVEDEEIFREMFGQKLESEGYCVEYAQNGVLANKLIAANDYDLIVTDMVMPSMGGVEVIKNLKLDEKKKDIPVIVLSASLDDDEMVAVKELGIVEFFEKTKVVPSDLSRKVAELLG